MCFNQKKIGEREMKTVTNKLIAIVLAMTLVLSMSGVAFADINSTAINPENVVELDAKASVKADVTDRLAKARPMSEDTMDVLSIKTITTSATSMPEMDEWVLEPDSYGQAAVTATTTGTVCLDFAVDGNNSKDCVDFMLFEKADDEYGYDMGRLRTGEYSVDEMYFYATKGTTYYFYFAAPETNTGNVIVSTYAKVFSNVSNRKLPIYAKSNQYMLSSSFNKAGNPSDLYYKVTPNKNGLMTVNLQAYGDAATVGKVTLYNANKKALSAAVQYNSSKTATKAYFGVAKGKNYFIRVQNCYAANGNMLPYYGIKYNMTAATARNL